MRVEPPPEAGKLGPVPGSWVPGEWAYPKGIMDPAAAFAAAGAAEPSYASGGPGWTETPRESVLSEAAGLITGDRNQAYGTPTQNFQDTADVWTVQLSHKLRDGVRIEPGEVAQLMVALKLVRMKAQPKRDNWVDVAGYAACGFEAEQESGRIGG